MKIIFWDSSGYPNILALGYAAGAYGLGLIGLMTPSWTARLGGVLLLTHALMIAAYLIHECVHNTIFADKRWNARLGATLAWWVGVGYGRYEDIRHKHFRHHVDRADVISFDFRRRLPHYPRLLRLLQVLEWAYVPAVDLMMHALVLMLPFHLDSHRDRRSRVLMVFATRAVFFVVLAYVSVTALMLYALAYLLFLHAMRFFDVHQHTYEVWETLERARTVEVARFDRDYEQRNTYSNLLSVRHRRLNLLVLNFPYHNAHHVKPAEPWYRLPRLHADLFGSDAGRVLRCRDLLASYHRYRVARILNGDAPNSDVGNGREFVGVVGVSFLTAH